MRVPSVVFWAVLVLCALPTCTKKTRSIPLMPPEVPTSGEPAARRRFEDVRARFERDNAEVAGAAQDFGAIARDFPTDIIAPYALFYAGRASLRAKEYAEAAATLEAVRARHDVDTSLRRRSALDLGIAYGYLSRHVDALALLEDVADVAASDAERAERHAVMAEAFAATEQVEAALNAYDAWFELATAPERAYMATKLDALSAVATTAGDAALAARAQRAAERVRAALGQGAMARSIRSGEPGLVGAALPVSGKRARVGIAALRGIGLAAGTFGTPRTVVGGDLLQPFMVTSHDSESSAAAASSAVEKIVADGAIAVVGPLDIAAVRAAGRVAGDLGVPMIALDTVGGRREDNDSPFLFHIVLSPEARARVLAQYALERGVRRFAVLAPTIDYGGRVAEAFVAQVQRGGGLVVAQAAYRPKTTSFSKVIDVIVDKPFDALFVPDTARRLGLIAPALASANLFVQPLGVAPPVRGRRIALLSTAEALSPRYLRGAGRYSHGAVLAPGFYADEEDPIIGGFVEHYEATYGAAPVYLDAYAYDAALVIRAAVEAGASDRAEVGGAIARSVVQGLTGVIRFGSDHRRADAGVLFRVIRDDGGAYRIRAMR